jgi:hypothetical protein
VSRRCARQTPMTWPDWPIARYTQRH